MTITSIKPRRDGKYLVGLHFNHGANLRKIMTPEELESIRAKVEEDRKREEVYRLGRAMPA